MSVSTTNQDIEAGTGCELVPRTCTIDKRDITRSAEGLMSEGLEPKVNLKSGGRRLLLNLFQRKYALQPWTLRMTRIEGAS